MANNQLVDNNAEATVIATILKHPDFILNCEMLKPKHFYNVENGCIMWCIQELYKSGIDNIDALNISNIASSNASVKKVLQKHNITDLSEFIYLSSFAARDTKEEFMVVVKQVVTMAYKRDLTLVLNSLKDKCYDDKIDLKTLETEMNVQINNLTESYVLTKNVELFSHSVDSLWEEIESERNDKGYGIPTIFPILTEKGIVHDKGELILLTAKRKTGKSLILMNELIEKLKMDMSCLYFDTEMSDKLFMIRMLANITGIPQKQIKSGDYDTTEKNRIRKALDWLKTRKFMHIFSPTYNEQTIDDLHKIFQYKYGLDMTFYDYFKSNKSESVNNYNTLGSMCDFLKSLAGKYDIPVLAAAQLNREGEIADSFKLEMYSSCGISYREKTQEEIMNDGGLNAGNFLLHVDYARSAESMGDDEYINVSVDGARMRAKQAEVQPKEHSPFDEM